MKAGRTLLVASLFAAAGLAADAAVAQSAPAMAKPPAGDKLVARGRYLVKIAGCNDCHTDRYMEKNGDVPEAQWLTGSSFGWRGPWGTTYPVNLRLLMQSMTEEQWLKYAATLKARPPMPWYVLHQMAKNDVRAIYRYIRHLGPAGEPAPAFVPPDKEPKPPYATFPPPPPPAK
jgi:mono/diheme cytochrome c family protein